MLLLYVLVAMLSSVCYSESCDRYDLMKCLEGQLIPRVNQKEQMCKLLKSESDQCLNEAVQHCPAFVKSTYNHLQHSLMMGCQAQVLSPVGRQRNSLSRLKRQSGKCDNSAIITCSQRYQSDVLAHSNDQSYICQLTRNYITNCLKANTEGCPSLYDTILSQARSSFNVLEGHCGNLCISRGSCGETLTSLRTTYKPTIGPGPTQHTSQACQRSATATLKCTDTYLTDLSSNMNDKDYICKRTKTYIQVCVKANTIDCPEFYERVLKEQQSTLSRLEQQCGDLCLSRDCSSSASKIYNKTNMFLWLGLILFMGVKYF